MRNEDKDLLLPPPGYVEVDSILGYRVIVANEPKTAKNPNRISVFRFRDALPLRGASLESRKAGLTALEVFMGDVAAISVGQGDGKKK